MHQPAGLKMITLPAAENTCTWRFVGERGPFAVLEGDLPADVLSWLREGFAAVDQTSWSFKANPRAKDRRVENGCKLEVVGQLLSAKRTQQQLFGMHAGAPVFERWRAWRKAFCARNAASLEKVQAELQAALRGLHPDSLGLNGAHLLDKPLREWFWAFGCCQLMKGQTKGSANARQGRSDFVGRTTCVSHSSP